MKWFSNMKVRMKMIVSFAVVIALMVVLVVFAAIQLQEVDNQNIYAASYPGARETEMLQYQSSLRDLRRVVASKAMYAPMRDLDRINALTNDSDTAYSVAMSSMEQYKESVRNDPQLTESERNYHYTRADEVMSITERYMNEICNVVDTYAKAGEYERAVETVIAGGDLIASMRTATYELIETAQAAAEAADIAATDAANQAIVLLIVIAAVAAVFAVLIAMYVAGSISKPLTPLTNYMIKAAATGDFEFDRHELANINKYGKQKDEIGQCIGAVADLMNEINHEMDELDIVARGDFTVKHNMLSDKDKIGLALTKLVDSFNNTLAEINSVSAQVSTGSRQIADGAQTLAQGSTEQASSIQELSASIHEIAERTKANAETAGQDLKAFRHHQGKR